MGDPRGFLKTKRRHQAYRPVCDRTADYDEVLSPRSDSESQEQSSRCMDCGIPFCHWGCPVGNLIPEWNDLVHRKKWLAAYELLQGTNNFPEFTGRICPATCEYACVLGINDDPVTIRENELSIVEHAFNNGLVRPRPPAKRTGKRVAVVGSGPAGLACADQLNRAGHFVTVFERDQKIGGILRYGIPDFKLKKDVIDRRVALLRAEGIRFAAGTEVGGSYASSKLVKDFDAACLTGGSRIPRDLAIEGRHLAGIHFAMDYLTRSNRKVSGEGAGTTPFIDARGKKVVVIGGGDTGADCMGTAHRQGASCVVQIELLDRPPECRTQKYPWPTYPMLLKSSTSHEEGGERHWAVETKRFIGKSGAVQKLLCGKVEFIESASSGCQQMREKQGSDFEIEADLVILAMGFLHPEKKGMLTDLGVTLDQRGNVKTGTNYMTSVSGIFSAGDMRRGQSLIVWAISEGRKAARGIDAYLMGSSSLPVM